MLGARMQMVAGRPGGWERLLLPETFPSSVFQESVTGAPREVAGDSKGTGTTTQVISAAEHSMPWTEGPFRLPGV